MIVDYIDGHREEFGVEPLQGPADGSEHLLRRQAPPARTLGAGAADAVMMQVLLVLWVANRKVYGAHKLWKVSQRAGHDIGRDQVARLMRELGIQGVSRRRKVFTTRQDPDALRAPDLVNRYFTATASNQLWVTDLTYVPTRSGTAYVCFIVDTSPAGSSGGG